jgi:sodium-dependent dicarboxylate transporter 2/3/5
VSTPPNAILFASGKIELKDMMRAGIVLNFLSLATIILLSLLLVDS